MSLVLNGVCDTVEKLLAGGCYWLEHSPLCAPFWASSLIKYLPENSDLLLFKPLIKDQQPSLCSEMHADIFILQAHMQYEEAKNSEASGPWAAPLVPFLGVALLGVSLVCFPGASVNRSLQAELLSGGPSVKRTPPIFSMSHYTISHRFRWSTRW